MLNTRAIVERIEEIRNSHQLSAAGFASKIGVQRSAMSHILSGRNKPSLEFLMKIYSAFEEVTLEWLIVGNAPPILPKNKTELFDSIQGVEDDKQAPLQKYPTSKEIEVQNQIPIPAQKSSPPKEIIYLYADGSFERFTPKK